MAFVICVQWHPKVKALHAVSGLSKSIGWFVG
jgi:hypothetical protein